MYIENSAFPSVINGGVVFLRISSFMIRSCKHTPSIALFIARFEALNLLMVLIISDHDLANMIGHLDYYYFRNFHYVCHYLVIIHQLSNRLIIFNSFAQNPDLLVIMHDYFDSEPLTSRDKYKIIFYYYIVADISNHYNCDYF